MHHCVQRANAGRSRLPGLWQVRLVLLAGMALLLAFRLPGADLEECRKLWTTGQYEACHRLAAKAIEENEYAEDWRLLETRALLALGRYPEAQVALFNATGRFPTSLRLRLLGHEVYTQNGDPDRARALLKEINTLANYRSWAYRDAENLVTMGRTALLLGAEPRKVLETFYDLAKQADPNHREPCLAGAELALDKGDYDLAAKLLTDGLKKFKTDPDFHYHLARAYAPGDRRQMMDSLDTALRHNTNHVPSLLLLADHLIDAEDYAEAGKTLDKVVAVNPWHPEAWALRAVLKHLAADARGAAEAREQGLHFWKTNPRVDHLIGRKLSQKYRFAEGAACQRQALTFAPDYLPAKSQLAQDLLRLGEDAEGWKLADEVHRTDGYDVVAYNLSTLHESVSKFQTLTNRDFIVRMSAHEAAIYGGQVLALLQRAKAALCAKYGLELPQPTIVEIFPEQKDFAVRTFGMPGGAGYLGVCFGRLITANSPASQAAHPANWEAVLWHEFCHVVTLQMTRNKMPRWLSEGISVYEELQANALWGQTMTPKYREMILNEELTPVSELSAAFLAPPSAQHLQFAYYESALVVEFIVRRYGLEKLKLILRDLAQGQGINQAIAAHTAPLEELEKNFAAFARQRAEQLAPGLDWGKPTPEDLQTGETAWAMRHPTNFWVLNQQARKLIAEKKFKEAQEPLRILIKLFPSHTESDNAYTLLAAVHRKLNETNQERDVLSQLAARSADAVDAYLRLMELAAAARDWQAVTRNGERFLAVNPLLAQPYRLLARAHEALGQPRQAIDSYRTLLKLDPADPADVHFGLARLLYARGDPAAKRHVLQALEEAPRFRDAHRLLLEINRAKKNETSANTPP